MGCNNQTKLVQSDKVISLIIFSLVNKVEDWKHYFY